jgi:3-methyladenine DNA glycosylase AlkD
VIPFESSGRGVTVTGPDQTLVRAVRDALASAADPDRATAMRAYMKSVLPFRGVSKPARVAVLRPVLAASPPRDRATWEATVATLYDDAGYREERYAALALLDVRAARPWRDPDLVPLLEHLVVVGAWWDLVDEIAARQVAPLHRAWPTELAPVIRRWSVSEHLWLRRAALLSQLGSGAGTDRVLLADVIEANAASRELFLRKAIGWALRDLARRDPVWVTAYLGAQGSRLSPLSRREAAKHLPVDRTSAETTRTRAATPVRHAITDG